MSSARQTNLLGAIDYDGAVAWVQKYCATHPLDHVWDAADNLAEALTIRH